MLCLFEEYNIFWKKVKRNDRCVCFCLNNGMIFFEQTNIFWKKVERKICYVCLKNIIFFEKKQKEIIDVYVFVIGYME